MRLSRRKGETKRRILHEPNDSNDLDECKDEFSFRVATHTKKIDGHNDDQEDNNPNGVGGRVAPEADGDGRGDDLERQHDEPLQSVVPAHGKSPCRVEEAGRVGREGAGDGESDGHLAERLHGGIQHEAYEGKGDDERGGATVHQGFAGANEEAGSYLRVLRVSGAIPYPTVTLCSLARKN